MTKSDQNAPEALRQSLEMGYGLETDIRDRNGAIVVSHDCPDDAAPLLSTVWDSWKALASDERPLALNVKADGLARMLRAFRDDRRVLLCTDWPRAFQDFVQ